MYDEEMVAIEKGYKYFIVKIREKGFLGMIEKGFLLYLRNNDQCGNSHSGDFDYHYYYHAYRDAKKDAILLS